MAKNNTITFYDLALSTGATISPFVWATKFAVKHKGFDLDVVPGGFTKIPERTDGRTERLPAIVDPVIPLDPVHDWRAKPMIPI